MEVVTIAGFTCVYMYQRQLTNKIKSIAFYFSSTITPNIRITNTMYKKIIITSSNSFFMPKQTGSKMY